MGPPLFIALLNMYGMVKLDIRQEGTNMSNVMSRLWPALRCSLAKRQSHIAAEKGDWLGLAKAELRLRRLQKPGEPLVATPANVTMWRAERGLSTMVSEPTPVRTGARPRLVYAAE